MIFVKKNIIEKFKNIIVRRLKNIDVEKLKNITIMNEWRKIKKRKKERNNEEIIF